MEAGPFSLLITPGTSSLLSAMVAVVVSQSDDLIGWFYIRL